MDLSLDKQSDVLANSPAGDHYKGFTIEPIQYTEANKLGFHEGNIVKYVTRWRLKNGVLDLKKARFYLERLIQIEERRQPPDPPIAAGYDNDTGHFTSDPGDESRARND